MLLSAASISHPVQILPASQVPLHIGQNIFDALGQHWIHFCPCWQYVVLTVSAPNPIGLHMQFEMGISATSKQLSGRFAAVSMAMGCCEGLGSNKSRHQRNQRFFNTPRKQDPLQLFYFHGSHVVYCQVSMGRHPYSFHVLFLLRCIQGTYILYSIHCVYIYMYIYI